MKIEWDKKIVIDKNWVDRQLNHHFDHKAVKLVIRGYTPKVSGNLFSCEEMIGELGLMITEYALSNDRKQKEMEILKKSFDELPGNGEVLQERDVQQKINRVWQKKSPNRWQIWGTFAFCIS